MVAPAGDLRLHRVAVQLFGKFAGKLVELPIDEHVLDDRRVPDGVQLARVSFVQESGFHFIAPLVACHVAVGALGEVQRLVDVADKVNEKPEGFDPVIAIERSVLENGIEVFDSWR